MQKSATRCFLCLLLVLTICLSAVPGAGAADSMDWGSVTARTVAAWTNDAVSDAEIRELLNSQELHPQKTGWYELDSLLGSLIAESGADDAYGQLRYMYEWMVKNVTYSWEGYSNTQASVASYNSVTGYNYLDWMNYDTGLTKSIPDDMANRTYHLLYAKKGVCYDYGIAYAVIARYIGIESYVRTGIFIFEDTANGSGHHGWTVLMLDGKEYIFDVQRDARNWQYHGRNWYYFGIPEENTYRYIVTYAQDAAANPERAAQMLPMTEVRRYYQLKVYAQGYGSAEGGGVYAENSAVTISAEPVDGYRFTGWYDAEDQLVSKENPCTIQLAADTVLTARFGKIVTVSAVASRSGTVEGGGEYPVGEQVTLQARSPQVGWYDRYGNLMSAEEAYTFTAQYDTVVYALFGDDIFADIPAGAWYLEDVLAAVDQGLTKGISPVLFGPEEDYTRAMAVVMFSRLAGGEPEVTEPAPFEDVPENSYYARAVAWAYQNGIVKGVSETEFKPEEPVTREQFLTMAMRYLQWKENQEIRDEAPEGTEATEPEAADEPEPMDDGAAESAGNAEAGTLAEPETAEGAEPVSADNGEPEPTDETEPSALDFVDADQISNFALEAVRSARALGLVEGYDTGELRPQAVLSRSEGTVMILRLRDLKPE